MHSREAMKGIEIKNGLVRLWRPYLGNRKTRIQSTCELGIRRNCKKRNKGQPEGCGYYHTPVTVKKLETVGACSWGDGRKDLKTNSSVAEMWTRHGYNSLTQHQWGGGGGGLGVGGVKGRKKGEDIQRGKS